MVVIGERAAVGAADLLAGGERREVAPGRGLGNLETGADFIDGHIGVVKQPSGELLTACGDDMEGDFQSGGGRRYCR